MSSQPFFEAVKARRTYYALKKESTISDKKIQEIIEQAILNVPSAFNSQSSRLVLLLGAEHDQLWDITKEALRAVVPADAFPATEGRINGFKAGYGTVLFFSDRATISSFQEKFAIFAKQFPTWATQSDAMHQYAIWVALEAEGLGANLQHYNPLIDAKVAEKWNIPKDWELSAQLVFGTPAAKAGEKTSLPVEGKLKVYGGENAQIGG